MITPAIYDGTVTHKRLRPVVHELNYKVASLLVDVDDLRRGARPGLLGYNSFNLFAIHDRDHGEVGNTGAIADFAWGKVAAASVRDAERILMLCYPRILGHAFNPLTTYYVVDANDELRLMIYEVHNTFGGRHIYVTDPIERGAPAFFETEKVFPVSPFNKVEGTYTLRASKPGEKLSVGVALSTREGPLLKAYFHGHRKPLRNQTLLWQFLRMPFMSLKVFGGIHWEALKLWLKGLNLQRPQ